MKFLLSSHLLLLIVLSTPPIIQGYCSGDKRVKLYRFCTYGNHDSGENGEHILQLQGQQLTSQPQDFKEDACHTVNYDSQIVGYYENLVVGTTEHDSDPGEHNQNFKTELYNNEWYSNTCGTYSVSVSMNFGSHTRVNACWQPLSGDSPGYLYMDRCPSWYEARIEDSFTFFLEISPADQYPTPTPPTWTPPTPQTWTQSTPQSWTQPSNQQQTQDYPPGWVDADGYDCDWYAQNAVERCYEYGHSYRRDGYVANQACVACGGGGGASHWKQDYPPGWKDADGNGCDWFGELPDYRCYNWGHSNRYNGYVANEACVVCGGGQWA